MSTIVWSVCFLVLTVLCVVTVKYVYTARRRQVIKGLQILQALRMLVKHIQVHRGLTVVYLTGNNGVKESIKLTADSVMSDVHALARLEESFAENENWLGITKHWARLSSAGLSLKAYENYMQHSKLVASCLALMVTSYRNYCVVGDIRISDHVYWHRLLALGEYLGQLRALGVIYLSNGSDGELKRKSLVSISKSISKVDEILKDRSLRYKIGAMSCEEINTFLALVDHYIVSNKSWITHEQYFSRATETIEIVYQKFDVEMKRLLA